MTKKSYHDIDKTLLLAMLSVLTAGFLAIYSATEARGLPFNESFLARQLTWAAVGSIFLFISVFVSYQNIIDASYVIYAVNVAVLGLVLMLGHVRLGAQRWISIGSFAFQPSEFIKLSLILVLSHYVGIRRDSMRELKSLAIPCVLLGIPFVLVLLQPDLGTALLLIPVFLSIMYIGGAPVKYLLSMVAAGIAAMPFFWHVLRDYQKQRLLVFLNPNIDPLGSGYTIIQSKIAIGSGGILGKGWLSGTQNQLNFLPERHTDFIFAVVGEEWGFFGAGLLILAYFVIVNRAFIIAALTGDMYGKAVATGIAVLLSSQVLINIGMTLGMMPVVGIPLPLVSYGGSSLIATFIAVGLLVNIGIRRSRF